MSRGSTCGCGRRPRSRRSCCRSTRRSRITNPRRCRGSGRPSSAPAPAPATRRSASISSTSIEPFVWRRSLDFGVIDDIRQISARIRDHFAQGAPARPGLRPQARPRRHPRGRVLRPDPADDPRRPRSVGARAGDARCARSAGRRRAARPGDARRAWPTPTGCCGRSSTACRWSRTRRPTCSRADPEALDDVARLHGLEDGRRAARPAAAARRARRSACSTASRRKPAGGLSNDPDILLDELRDARLRRPRALAARRIADWRSGRARSLRSPAAQDAFEAMLPGLLHGDRRRPRPRPCAQPADRHRRAAVERDQPLPPARGAAQARRSCWPRSSPMRRRLSDQLARRPELLEGLFDASSFDLPPAGGGIRARRWPSAMRGQPYDVALDRARRLVNERRFALGVQLIDRRDDPLEVAAGYARVAEGTLLALADAAVREFESAHGRIPGGELVILGLGRLGGCALTHASDLDLIYLYTGPAGVRVGRRQAARPERLFQPAGEPGDRRAQRPDRRRAALRRRHPAAAGGRQGHAGRAARRASPRYQREEAWTWEHMALCRARPVFGSPRGARARPAHASTKSCGMPRDTRQIACRRGQRCAPRWSATSRRRARSTSSSGRAGWSTSNSRSTCSS